MKESPLVAKIGQAYQVIGICWGGSRKPTEEEWQRALDYFSDEERYDEDFLPWPREYTDIQKGPPKEGG